LTRSTLSKVAPDGVWKAVWGAQTAVSEGPMDNIWEPNGLKQVNFPMFTDSDPEDFGEAADLSCQFGISTYHKYIWEDFTKAECIVEIKEMVKKQQEAEEGKELAEKKKTQQENYGS